MRNQLPILVAGLLCATAVAGADPHHAAKADPDFTFIRQAYAYMASGVQALDVNREFEYTTPDYVDISPSGKVSSKAECEQAMYSLFQQIDADRPANAHASDKETILSLSRSGQNIIAVVRESFDAGLGVNDLVNGKTSASVHVTGVARDTWVPTPDGWAIQKSVEERVSKPRIHKSYSM